MPDKDWLSIPKAASIVLMQGKYQGHFHPPLSTMSKDCVLSCAFL